MKKRMIVTTAAALCLAAALGTAVWWFTPCTVANNEKYTITVERGKWILRPGPELEAFYPSCDPSDSGGPEFVRRLPGGFQNDSAVVCQRRKGGKLRCPALRGHPRPALGAGMGQLCYFLIFFLHGYLLWPPT